ncbi:unnamed protein product, partial [marine sediment metagenome]
NTVIEKGEVTSSLVGPLVALHHQALLIAAIWPGGRGNVSAGALVGSNHTGRAADQEIMIGEGVFFGLGVNVKLPIDLMRAPYTIIAPGPLVSPQRMEFPFSLVREPGAELAEAFARAKPRQPVPHEMLPGWVLAESPYTVVRAGKKYRDRYRAKRSPLDTDPLRPEVLALVRDARDRLRAAPEKDIYTGEEIPGLGACAMSEAGR